MKPFAKSLAAIAVLALPCMASASDLYAPGGFSALASDNKAQSRGDIVMIVIYENASATNSATSGSKKGMKVAGSISGGSSFDEAAQLGLSGASDNAGETGRAGKMVAQISAVIENVLPNGDLILSGEQTLKINGEATHIRLRGRVRTADISAQNAVLSSRLAEAAIDYDGSGFVSRSARPGVISQIFNFLGLL